MSRKNEFSRRNKRRSTPAVSTYASLESRKMLASISFDSGTLTLDGSGGDDVFRVNRIGATTLVARIDTPFETIIESFSLRSVNNVEIIGRNGDDLFNNGSDVQSTFFGQNGNDRAFGGRAADTFFGGDGDDLFFGRQGFDTAFGGNGNDTLFGAEGDDVLEGQGGNDFIYGGSGDDQVLGNEGRDRVFGNNGDDEILGGDGDDFLAGGNGEDTLSGDAGNDILRGGNDADELFGGDGNDSLLAEGGNDVSHGGAGNDFIFDHLGEQNVIFGDAGNDVLAGGDGSEEIHGGDGNDRLFGGAGDDSLYGDGNVDFLAGGDGRDGLFGGLGLADTLIGGAGDDRFLTFTNQNFNRGQSLDNVVDAQAEDAVVGFVSNLEVEIDRVIAAGRWTNEEIKTVDGALRNLHWEVADTRLLKLADGQDLSVLRLGDVRTEAGFPVLGLNFTDSNQIGFTDQLFEDFSDRIRETVYHEVGHNFDTVQENAWVTDFRAISNWDQVQNTGDRLSLDGQWYYNDDFNNFLTSNARVNPLEDFAVTFAEHFQNEYDGFQRAFVNPVEKFDLIESFLRS